MPRRVFEIGAWALYLLVANTIGATSALIEHARAGLETRAWEPFVWEYSSGLVIFALIPAVLHLERRAPFTLEGWKAVLPLHLLATIPFSLAHVAGMVAIRKICYALAGRSYEFGTWPNELLVELFYEYRKDALTYFIIIAVINAYRLFRAKIEGRATLATPETAGDKPVSPSEAPSIWVERQGVKLRLPLSRIAWIEAAGNYVILHSGGRGYALRKTMKAIEAELDDAQFVRVHRSAIVNRAQIRSVASRRAGETRLELEDGTFVRASRRYASLAGLAEAQEPLARADAR
ncbi:MAG: LytTR family DNA-binding domain-containing protein [Parvularculaceae bacterium]